MEDNRNASSSIDRNRSRNCTFRSSPRSRTSRSNDSRYRSPSSLTTSGWVWPATRYSTSGCSGTISASASIAVSMPLPAEISPKVDSTVRPARWAIVRWEPSVSGAGLAATAASMCGNRMVGAPCGTTRTRPAGATPESTTIRRAVSVNTVTSAARWHSSPEYLGLPLGRRGQHRVQRHDEGLAQFLDQRQHVGAGLAAEDSVFVLDQHHIGAAAVQQCRHRDVVGADVLPDDRQHLRFRSGMVIADDRDDIDVQRRVHLEQCRAKIAGKGADAARPRRIRGNNGHSHGHRGVGYAVNGA